MTRRNPGRSRFTRTASSLRHLCSLGLPGETVVPQFLATLEEAIPSDSHHFHWLDDEMRLTRSYSNLAGVEPYVAEFARLLESQPAGSAEWAATKRAALQGEENARKRAILDFFDNEIRRPLGGRRDLLAFLSVARQPLGSINLWRGEGRGYTPHEQAFLHSVSGYLGYALKADAAPGSPLVEDEDRGVVLLDGEGNILRTDERAEHLLHLAAVPEEDAPEPALGSPGGGPQALCRKLVLMSTGRPASPPQHFRRNAWGLFGLRAHWLRPPAGDGSDMVAVTVSLHVPRKLKLWRSIHALGLPARQQEVCLLFAEGHSLTEIAQRLGISRHTAIDHMRRIYERLEIEPDRDCLRERLLAGVPSTAKLLS